MKFPRIFFSFLIGFAASLFLALTFFGYSTFDSPIDRLFLLLVPALAIGLTLHQAFPSLSAWMQRIRTQFTILYYLLGFLFALKLTYGLVGYLQAPLRTPYNMALFTAISITLGSVIGYYLFQRAANSILNNSFLSKPLNILLVLILPVFSAAIIYGSAQFPSMFVWEYITVPQKWTALFFIVAISAGVWSLALLEKIEQSAFFEKLAQTRFFHFLSENLPGLYAGGMFFIVQAILARAINHPALTYNTVLFEADAGPWMEILASPAGGSVGRAVHPLSVITIRPLIRLVAGIMGEHYALGGMLVTSAIAGLCVFMIWFFVKRATDSKTYAFLFSVMLGSTSTHLLFGSLTENYIFGAASLIFFFLLIQKDETRFLVLVPAGLLLFGITITNIVQGIIGLFFNKFGFRRLIQYGVTVLAFGILLTVLVSVFNPGTQGLFFIPADITFEMNFVSSNQGSLSDPMRLSEPASITRKLQVVTRSVLLYGVVAPQPLDVISEKPPFPTIDLKTYDVRTKAIASYKGLANLPLTIWLILLSSGFLLFLKNIRTSQHTPLMLGFLGVIAFNFLLHLFYGTEIFLYTSYWVYAFVLFLALAFSEYAHKIWLQWGLAVIVLVFMMNNYWFIFTIQKALAPFYAAIP
ncbi:MAG: hypothetical protein FJ031_00120 [Chloroflexi bacterium]|nr:hypothetical protein [Chloroflexota bacterium]